MSASEKISNTIRQLFYILFFVTPLVLWPFTSEVFEFNKMLFVYLITILVSSAWVIKSLLDKKFTIAKTPLDLPILLFLISQIISTIVSINPHTSLWGYYSRFHGGLVSTISYIILFYALVTHFQGQVKAIKNIVIAILSSASLISFYAILEHFGIDKHIWIQDVQSRVFSTLGQPNWLSAFLVALLPLSLFQITSAKENSTRLLHLGLSVLFLVSILYTKSQSGIGATVIVLLLFAIITAVQKQKSALLLLLVPLIVLLIIFKGDSVHRTLASLNKINPFFSDTLTIINEENKTRIGGSDSMAIRRVVWKGAIKLGLKYPLFGTGVETFGYSYYNVRPPAHNLTSESDFLYNKAHNEYLNFLATSGFVGLLTYLFLIFSIIRVFLVCADVRKFRLPLLLGFISILITNYIGFSVVNIALFFFLFPALALASIDSQKLRNIKIKLDQSFGIFLVLTLSFWGVLFLRRIFLADLAYNKGSANLEEATRAVSLNPREAIYHAQLGYVASLVTTQVIVPQIKELPASTSADIKAQAQTIYQKYLNLSVDSIAKAQELNPYNLNVLKTKAKTEIVLASLDSKYYQNALLTLLRIVELSPTEPNGYLNIGVLYQQLNKNDLAKIAFEKALTLDPNHGLAKEYLQKLTP